MTEVSSEYGVDHYVQRLDLGDDPFNGNSDKEYFYSGAARGQILDQLVHFVRFGEQVVVLLGATGSGTSSLLDQSLVVLEDLMDCCYINGDDETLPEQIMSSLNEQLQLRLSEPVDPAHFLEAIKQFSLVDGEPEPFLLAVDQAHYLSFESFELLRKMVAASGNIVRLLLVGEYQVEQLAKLASFGSGQIKILELEPLSSSETGEYLLGKLQSVGYAGDMPLNSDQLAVLYEQAGGNLAEINQLAPVLLSSQDQNSVSHNRFGIPLIHGVAIAVLAVVLLISWAFQSSNDNPGEESAATVSIPLDLSNSQMHRNEMDSASEPSSKGSSAVVADGAGSATTVTDTMVVASASGDIDRSSPATADSTIVVTETTGALSNNIVEKELISARSQSIPKIIADVAVPKKAKPTVITEKPTNQTPQVVKPVKSVSEPGHISPREQRILNLPVTAYMLQLMGAVDESRTRGLVKKYIGRLPVTYFETRRKDKPWFVAVAGPYDTKEAALTAIKVLPPLLQKERPWARSVASLQQEIRDNRR
ncbi:MAG: AAA family ATPase [Oceanicoccus sp.]